MSPNVLYLEEMPGQTFDTTSTIFGLLLRLKHKEVKGNTTGSLAPEEVDGGPAENKRRRD